MRSVPRTRVRKANSRLGLASASGTIAADSNQREVVSGKLRRNSLVTLLLLSATLAEFLTGSTPIPRAVFNPLGFLLLVGLYGGGALLIRETAIRWGKRWGPILLLGGAYAVGEEGFGAKTMIDPLGSNIGNQLYSHFAGINWVPLAGLTLFHAAFSIAVPLVIVELLFPETRGKPLVGGRGMAISLVVYAVVVIFLSFADPYPISVSVGLFLALYAASYIVAAYRVPKDFLQAKGGRPDRSERRFLLLGVGFLTGFFLSFTLGARFLPWPITTALFIPLVALTGMYLVNHAGRFGNEIVKVDFVLGMTIVFVPLDVIQEINGDVGVLVYTGLILALLLVIRRRIVRGSRELAVAVSGPPLSPA